MIFSTLWAILPFYCAAQATAHYAPSPNYQYRTSVGDVNITYKEVPKGICGTTATSFAGYVQFPKNTMTDVGRTYPINTFFWFFKAQDDPDSAPLSIWLNGGPGGSSMAGPLLENGPCTVNEDSKTTRDNQWSWNKKVNMLYVDQPVQAGFSYDELFQGRLNLSNNEISLGKTDPATGTLLGHFTSQKPEQTANTTMNAARQFWHFMQAWVPHFEPYSKKSTNGKLSLWTESYGGRYGPAFMTHFLDQNEKIRQGTIQGTELDLDTLGIINGCIDTITQELSDMQFGYDRNPYGIEALDNILYTSGLVSYTEKGGCYDKTVECRALAARKDPGAYGNDSEVNGACAEANNLCIHEYEDIYTKQSHRGYYDIGHCDLDPYPPNYWLGYLGDAAVQEALGVPVNFTMIAPSVDAAFNHTGDYPRLDIRGYLEDIGYLLDHGVKVSLIYGDRDFACNWVGGERASLAVRFGGSRKFELAGYANLELSNGNSNSPPSGQVRQHGHFSFVRVYESGHMVPAYQPETAFEIFNRVMFNFDVATGKVDISKAPDYSTDGEFESTATFPAPEEPRPTCYLLAMPGTCTQNQIDSVMAGTAEIKDYVVIKPEPEGDYCHYTELESIDQPKDRMEL
ncbi:carboxypeptidase S1-like protein A [Aspergillus lucknowensis]|uniref:Carboxypeptidase S1-like protein A n=1 Tax=Aspergillus lucknowensis TaxID=176173 RepID=A0ABR4LN00_9EURO